MDQRIVRNVFLLLCFIFYASVVQAQYAKTIRSGRPGLAIGPYTVGKGVFQNQSGMYMVTSENRTGEQKEIQNRYAISVFRVGMTERFELGCGLSYTQLTTTTTDSLTGNSESTFSDGINLITMAMRVNINEGKGLVPAFGYQVNVGLPWGSEDFRPNHASSRITLLTAQSIEKFRFITNWAAIWNGNDAQPSGIYMLFIDRAFGKKIRLYVEHYGLLAGHVVTPKFDAGITYLINDDVQLDVQYGKGPEVNHVSDQFVSVGIGWRLRLTERPVMEK